MKLTTAFTKSLPYWNSILGQVGLPFTQINWKKNFLEEYAVIVINSALVKEELKQILEYVDKGGSILTEAGFFVKVNKTKKVYIKYLYSNEKIFGYKLPLIDFYNNSSVAVNSNLLNNQDKFPVVASFSIGKGNVIILPDKFVSSVFDSKILRKKFPSSIKKYPSERVSKISKGSIFHFIRSSLEYLYCVRNLPFVSLWNFPGNAKSIFSFRIDTDFGSQEEINLLYKTIKENNIRGTWFVEAKSAENWINKFSSFEDQEIGLHCYRHRVFKSYKKNYDNFIRGKQILKKSSILPKGTAAPFGEWNELFNKAAEDCGFEYSSEFSYTYDNLPHHTSVRKKLQNIIQIPTHPISFGRLFHAGFNDDEMYYYFIEVIKSKLALAEPIIIYTHPKEKRYEILKRIFNFVNEMNLMKCTFSEYAAWWRERSKINFSASFINGIIITETNTKDISFWFRVILPTKESYLIPCTGDESLKIIMNIPEYNNNDLEPDLLRKYSERMLKDDILFTVRKRKL